MMLPYCCRALALWQRRAGVQSARRTGNASFR